MKLNTYLYIRLLLRLDLIPTKVKFQIYISKHRRQRFFRTFEDFRFYSFRLKNETFSFIFQRITTFTMTTMKLKQRFP